MPDCEASAGRCSSPLCRSAACPVGRFIVRFTRKSDGRIKAQQCGVQRLTINQSTFRFRLRQLLSRFSAASESIKQPLAHGIQRIAVYRVPDMRKMYPELVRPSRYRLGKHRRTALAADGTSADTSVARQRPVAVRRYAAQYNALAQPCYRGVYHPAVGQPLSA